MVRWKSLAIVAGMMRGEEAMARDYQRKNGKYILPKAVYHQTLWRIRDYPRLVAEAQQLIGVHAPIMEGGGGGGASDPDKIGNIVHMRAKLLADVEAIDRALLTVPSEYRKGVWDNIVHGKPFPQTGDRSTYGRHKTRFICACAKELKIIL